MGSVRRGRRPGGHGPLDPAPRVHRLVCSPARREAPEAAPRRRGGAVVAGHAGPHFHRRILNDPVCEEQTLSEISPFATPEDVAEYLRVPGGTLRQWRY